MKRLFIISIVFSFSLSCSFAQRMQQKQKKSVLNINENTNLLEKEKTSILDSAEHFIARYGFNGKNNLSASPSNEMPVAKLSQNIHFNTPVKKLYGKGLSPMPGTEPLDLMEAKQDSFAKKNRVIKITTFPLKEEPKSKSSSPTNVK